MDFEQVLRDLEGLEPQWAEVEVKDAAAIERANETIRKAEQIADPQVRERELTAAYQVRLHAEHGRQLTLLNRQLGAVASYVAGLAGRVEALEQRLG